VEAPAGAPPRQSGVDANPHAGTARDDHVDGDGEAGTVPAVADLYLSQRALPHHVKRTVGQLRAVPDVEAAPEPSPLRPALAAARAPRGRHAAPAACRRIDCSGRLNIKALCATLGWDAGTQVLMRPGAHGYVATLTARAGGRGSLTGTVDAEGRLRLPNAVRAALDPDGCLQVLARASDATLELYPAALIDDLLDSLIPSHSAQSLVPTLTERTQP